MALNIVGTPWTPVQRSEFNASSVSTGSNPSPGKTIVVPPTTQAKLPSTMPKQWYKGTGIHSLSFCVSCILSATKRALLTIFVWVSVAAFGTPVVPEVNCRLIGSSGNSLRSIPTRRALSPSPPFSMKS